MRQFSLRTLLGLSLVLFTSTLIAEPLTVITWNGDIAKRGINENRKTDFSNLKSAYEPDLILLQEVKSHTEAKTLAEKLGLSHVATTDFSQGTEWYQNLEVAILSKHPLINKREYDVWPDGKPSASVGFTESALPRLNIAGIDERANPSRGFLVADVKDQNLTVIAVHMKSSRGSSGPEDHGNARKRERIAACIAKVIKDIKTQHPTRAIIVGGDFNVGERDQGKVGSSLNDDNDKYDDTHFIMAGGLENTVKLKSLSKQLGATYARGNFGDTGPIDCLYVSNELIEGAYAERGSETFGSDHYPVIALVEATATASSSTTTSSNSDNSSDSGDTGSTETAPSTSPAPIAANNNAGQSKSEFKVISWNVESPDNDATTIAQNIADVQDCAVWGLSEVNPNNAEKYRVAAEKGEQGSFGLITGSTGSNQRLAIIYSKARLTLLEKFELHNINPFNRVRSPLVAKFKGKQSGLTFYFMVNHLYRSNETARRDQASKLNQWAASQQHPTIAVGDYNFDWDIPSGGNDRDAGFDAMIADGNFKWIVPQAFITTQASTRYNSILDFVFTSGTAPGVTAKSRIITEGIGIFERPGLDTAKTSDHRPVEAIFTFGTSTSPVSDETSSTPVADSSNTASNDRAAMISALTKRVKEMESELAEIKDALEVLKSNN